MKKDAQRIAVAKCGNVEYSKNLGLAVVINI